ncbi:hypothetical protein FNB79_14775 [Formosa sediminum]|uniref:Uncharacterized protein n=1 Tax=Formosa sediminum TaxID=2594004 RepID=A0A516GUI7_9FLAO|nr:hypothetical protein [Formosa sediminum]QDO95183.1 hypothetical protein FNB79_14775 [Formosa sediminum]
MKIPFSSYSPTKTIVLLCCVFNFLGCANLEEVISEPKLNLKTWTFDTLEGWEDGSQNLNGKKNYSVKDGVLKMYTRANTRDRPKIKTEAKIYNQGEYIWRLYVPELGVGDQASIGAFIYADDAHELDFEIGYGSESARTKANANADEVLVYMTSQAHPFQSIIKPIKKQAWYTVTLELKLIDSKYQAFWRVDGIQLAQLQLNYGQGIDFYIFCSVENLEFIGDHIPKQDNYGLFDYVTFKAY